jgi:hypothetical protein
MFNYTIMQIYFTYIVFCCDSVNFRPKSALSTPLNITRLELTCMKIIIVHDDSDMMFIIEALYKPQVHVVYCKIVCRRMDS